MSLGDDLLALKSEFLNEVENMEVMLYFDVLKKGESAVVERVAPTRLS